MTLFQTFCTFLGLILTGSAFANPVGVNISGQILNSDNDTPLTATNVNFYLKVLSPSGCVLYSEEHLGTNLSLSSGTFSLVLGQGANASNIYNSSSPQSVSSLRLLFDNTANTVSSLSGASSGDCSSGIFTPTSSDIRKVRVEFNANNGEGLQTVDPDFTVRNIPYALFSDESNDTKKLGGLPASAYLQVSQLSASETDPNVQLFAKSALPSCGANEVLKSNGSSFSCVSDQTGGGATALATTTSTGIIQVGTGLNINGAGLLSVDYTSIKTNVSYSIGDLKTNLGAAQFPDATCSADKTLTWSAVTDTFSCTAIAITSANVSNFNASVDSRISADSTKVNKSGDTMSGTLNMNQNNLTNTGSITMYPGNSLHLSNTTSDPSGLIAADEGKVWYRTDTNEIKYWNGSAAVTLGTSGNYITALTGDITASGPGSAAATIANNAVTTGKISDGTILGADLNFTGVNNATSGLTVVDATGKFVSFSCGSAGDVATWTASGWSCQTPSPLLPALADGKIWVGDNSNAAVAQTMSGDATISNTGALALANSGVTAGTYSKVTVDAKGRVTVGAAIGSSEVTTALGYTPLNKAGDVMAGLLGLNGVASDPAGLVAGDEGKVWYRTDTNEIKYWNGSAAVTLGAAGSGLQSFNGLTDNSQTFVINSSGTDVAINSATGTHTLSIPSASAANRGVLTSADWTTFNSKLGTATSFSGDMSGNYNSTSVDKVKGIAVSATAPTSGQFLVYDGTTNYAPISISGDATMSNAGALTLANSGVTAGTYSKVTVDAKGRVTVGADIGSSEVTTALGYTPLNKAGDVMAGLLGLNGVASDPAGLVAGDEGKVWYRTDTNEIKYWNGSAAVTLGVSGAGMQSLNGLSDNTQTFALGTAGTAPAWTSASGTHTLDIPMASAAGTTAGLISKTDYDSFAGKQAAGNYITALTGDITASGPGSAAATIADNAITTGKISDGTILGADLNFTGVNVATSGIAIVDSTGKFTNFACGTTGDVATWTVTGWSCQTPSPLLPALADGKIWVGDNSNAAVAQTMSGDATISNAGALTIANDAITNAKISSSAAISRSKIAAGTANSVIINDGSGNFSSEAQLAISRGGTGASSFAADRLIVSNGTGSALTTFTCAVGKYLSFDAAGVMICANNPASTAFIEGGNSFTAAATLGTNDAYALNLETNNTTRMTLDSSGKVGIGTTSPRAALDVNSTVLLKPSVTNGTSTIDFGNGNLQHTSSDCGAFILHNMKDGGAYTFAVKGTNATTCSFTAYSDAGTTSITVHLPTDHGATTASKHTLYSFVVMGSDVYVSWMPGM